MKFKTVFFILLSHSVFADSPGEMGESEAKTYRTVCQVGSSQNPNIQNIQVLLHAIEERIQTYEYSSPANTEFFLNGREKVFECANKDMTKCSKINNFDSIIEDNFLMAKPGLLYDRRGVPLQQARPRQPIIQTRPLVRVTPQPAPTQRPKTLVPQTRPPVQLRIPESARPAPQGRPKQIPQVQRPQIQSQPQQRQAPNNHPDPNVGTPNVTENPMPDALNEISWKQIKEVNYARTNPHGYAKILEDDIRKRKVPGWMLDDYRITISVLKKRDPKGIHPLFPSENLSRRSQSWSASQARFYGLKHSSSSYGNYWAENVTQMGENPRFAVVGYIGEKRNVSWSSPIGHRQNIFSTRYRFIGIGTHGGYSTQQFSNKR